MCVCIRSEVTLSALDLHDDRIELTSLGGALMSPPTQHPLILFPTPPSDVGEGIRGIVIGYVHPIYHLSSSSSFHLAVDG